MKEVLPNYLVCIYGDMIRLSQWGEPQAVTTEILEAAAVFLDPVNLNDAEPPKRENLP